MSIEMEFALNKPLDPALLALLYGDAVAPPQYAIEITTPIRRKWWERLLWRPQRYSVVQIPHATLTIGDAA